MSKKPAIQTGQQVRIITPDFFVRCGYPWNKEYIVENLITPEQKKAIRDLIEPTCVAFPHDANVDNTVHRVLDAWAAGLLKRHGYGGKTRSIHTKRYDQFAGLVFEVAGRKMAITGTYQRGGGAYEDYEPPYLSARKSHVILELDVFNRDVAGTHAATDDYGSPLKIEDINVELVVKDQP